MIGVDATSTGTGSSTSGPVTWSHTCSGSLSVLWVGVYVNDATVIPTSASVTGVTYNSVSMTRATATVDTTAIGTYLYYLINPTTGSNTVSVGLDNTYSAIRTGGLSLTNAYQTTQPDSSNSFTATVQNPSNSITTLLDNTMMVDVIGVHGIVTMSATSVTGQIILFNVAVGTGAAGMSYRPAGIPGVQSMGWTTSASKQYAQSIAATWPSRPSVQTNNLRPHAFSPGLAR